MELYIVFQENDKEYLDVGIFVAVFVALCIIVIVILIKVSIIIINTWSWHQNKDYLHSI